MLRRTVLKGLAASAAASVLPVRAKAQEVLKMGICIPMTGAGFNAVGRQLAVRDQALRRSNTATSWLGGRLKSSCATTAA